MNVWLPIAIVGHLLNACAFLVDKALLSTAFKRSGTYAALIGGLSCLVFLAAPWTNLPSLQAWPAIACFGGLFVLAVWTFFEGLRRAEATRVVPIIGSLIPIFTLIDTSLFLGERLSTNGYIGFGLLVVATGILASGRGKDRLSLATVGICVLSAFLFAASSAFGKYGFQTTPFLDVFVWSRVSAGLVALGIALFAPGVRGELSKLIFVKSRGAAVEESFALGLMFFGQACGAFGFLLVQFAISQGSAAIVNALQAVQYAALVLVAWFGGKKIADLLHERHSTSIYLTKGSAIVLVAIGLYLVTYGI
ncbi:EamA family transporter [Candidatus Uhrbacteria bacterium]|nr:MAG: EamA family transporter [Candidatus Uhrbacteria bacterium]